MKITNSYTCEYCGKTYKTAAEAVKCEKSCKEKQEKEKIINELLKDIRETFNELDSYIEEYYKLTGKKLYLSSKNGKCTIDNTFSTFNLSKLPEVKASAHSTSTSTNFSKINDNDDCSLWSKFLEDKWF